MGWYHGYDAITKQDLIFKANWVGMGSILTIIIIPILTTITTNLATNLTTNLNITLNGKTNMVI